MPEDAVSIEHAEALRLIEEQLGEQVYLALFVTRAESESGGEEPIPFIHMTGRLGNSLEPRAPRLEPDVGFYGFGREAFDSFPFPPLLGKTQLRDNGIDFLISDTVRIRVAWRGSEEVGHSLPTEGEMKHLRALGVAGVLPKEDPLASRFIAEAQRAPAEVLEASSTEATVGSGKDAKRVWLLRVRVKPTVGESFETAIEVGWRVERDFENRIADGELLSAAPDPPAELEVAYDPTNPERVIPYPTGEVNGERTIKFGVILASRSMEPKRWMSNSGFRPSKT